MSLPEAREMYNAARWVYYEACLNGTTTDAARAREVAVMWRRLMFAKMRAAAE